jgi:hypothetical protein
MWCLCEFAGGTGNNVAAVFGNDSSAQAGPGTNNRARVRGYDSGATAFGDNQTATAKGNHVHVTAP